MHRFFPAVFLILPFISCYQKRNIKIDNWETTISPIYSFQYPKSWVLIKDPKDPVNFFLYTPYSEYSVGKGLRGKLFLVVTRVSGRLALSKATDYLLDAMHKMDNPVIISNESQMDDYGPFRRIVWSYKENNLTIEQMSRVRINGDKMYILTFVSSASDFDDYYQTVVKIMNTFVLID